MYIFEALTTHLRSQDSWITWLMKVIFQIPNGQFGITLARAMVATETRHPIQSFVEWCCWILQRNHLIGTPVKTLNLLYAHSLGLVSDGTIPHMVEKATIVWYKRCSLLPLATPNKMDSPPTSRLGCFDFFHLEGRPCFNCTGCAHFLPSVSNLKDLGSLKSKWIFFIEIFQLRNWSIYFFYFSNMKNVFSPRTGDRMGWHKEIRVWQHFLHQNDAMALRTKQSQQ